VGRKPNWWHMLQAAKDEALIAVDLYNRPRADRSLEGFVVHMIMAWLYLLHARFERDGVAYVYRDAHGKVETIDDQPKTWDLARCIRERFPSDSDPIRKNIEFFIPLRNMVEHRYAQLLEPVVAGKVQALIMNFERTVVEDFGGQESLGDSLRFPVFLSTLDDHAVKALRKLYARLPAKVRGFMEAYDANLPPDILDHPHYEFKVLLVPKVGNRGEPDLAVEFVQRDALTEEQRERLDSAVVFVRDRHVEVQNLGAIKPSEVVMRVAMVIPWFNMAHHTAAWKHCCIRPQATASDPTCTDARYCRWDQPHKDYVYTEAWVKRLIKELRRGSDGFEAIMGKTAALNLYPLPDADARQPSHMRYPGRQSAGEPSAESASALAD